MVTLDTIRHGAAPDIYPRHLLVGCESALVLFAAAFHGQQDAVWMAEAGLRATCVDIDEERLGEMEAAYPSSWEFVPGDVFEFATAAECQWDVVSVDCPTNLFYRCAEFLPVWCLLARHSVILGCNNRYLDVPVGWRETERRHRSNFLLGGVYWAVLERC